MSTSNTLLIEVDEQALNRGIETQFRNIAKDFSLNEDTLNANVGVRAGLGPRHGMQPVPFHAVDAQDSLGSVPNYLFPSSLAYSTRAASSFLQSRTRIYAIYPFKITQYDSVASRTARLTQQGITYFYVADMQYTNGSGQLEPRVISIGYGAQQSYTSVTDWIARQITGFTAGVAGDASQYKSGVIFAPVLNTARTVPNATFRRFTPEAQKNYYNTAAFTVSGIDNNFFNVVGYRSTFQSLSTNPLDWMFNGFSSQVNYAKLPLESTAYTVIVLGQQAANSNPQWYYKFQKDSIALTSTAGSSLRIEPDVAYQLETLNANIASGSGTTTAGSSAGSITRNLLFLFQSKNFKINSSYQAFMIAKETPVCAIYQDHIAQRGIYRSISTLGATDANYSNALQYFDPTQHYLSIQSQGSFNDDGVTKQTGFNLFPAYVSSSSLQTDATATRDGGVNHYALGAANTGLLRANTTYELAYSFYDKGTNTEGNVCQPVKFRTGSADFVKLAVWRQPTAGAAPAQAAPIAPDCNFLTPLLSGAGFSFLSVQALKDIGNYPLINHLEIRFYYRALGTFDWLPTSRFDAAEFWFDPTTPTRWICESAVSALPGGVPGGIVDNSPLAADKYEDVVVFQNHVFWMSAKRLCWSNKNDVFTYPALNSVTVNKGYCKGIKEHVYPGQSTQDSRLLLVTSDGIYAGRFDGELEEVSVRVDPNTSATFLRPGSNFRLSFWTSNTAFSARSMAIAKGVLFYWGPTGIFADDGATLPRKDFSLKIEPMLFDLYDPSRTDEIHAVYNDKTKQVIWFYPPRKTGTQSAQKALVYNMQFDAFFIYDFGNTLVDAAQIVDISVDNSNNMDGAGQRILLYVRDAGNTALPQQAVFFDQLCDAGDVKPSNIAFCSAVAVSGSNRRLTVSSSVALPTSGKLTIDLYNFYTDTSISSGNPDAIYTIAGGDGSTYIDIAPIGGSWTSFDFQIGSITSVKRRFPVQWEAQHGFTFSMISEYFLARGMRDWQRWLYCFQTFRLNELKRSASQEVTMKWRSLIGTGQSTRSITFADNAKGHMNVHSAIVFTQQNAEGPALSTEWTTASGKFCGSRWVVQYLGFDVTPLTTNNIKIWEG